MDVNERYSSSLASLLSSVSGSLPHPHPHPCTDGLNPGVINPAAEYILAHGVSGPLNSSTQQQLMGMDRSVPLGTSSWNHPVDNNGNLSLTVDATKCSYTLQGISLRSSSPPIARFSSDPGFAERAARFSAFGNGHFSQTFPLTDSGSLRPTYDSTEPKSSAAAKTQSSRGDSAPGSMASPDVSYRSPANGVEASVDGEDARSRLCRNSPAACSADEGCNGPNVDSGANSGPADSGATNGSRGGQETSSPDGDQGRSSGSQLSGKKRKSSSGDEAVKDGAASPVTKDQKNSANSKRSKGTEDRDDKRSKAERSDTSASSPQTAKDSKQVEHPKTDYIHVRARRGQATDSHSLAERVRREKISERMKFLQDLVPGCSKVTGKAVMLDEIINYVQSIQRQVEFLSMKLAAVTPRPDFNIDSFLAKQLQMGQNCGLESVMEHPESCIGYSQLPPLQSLHSVNMQQSLLNSFSNPNCVQSTLRRMNSAPVSLGRAPVETFGDCLSQMPGLWEGDLQSVVQMGFSQGRTAMGHGGYHCDLPPGHMKVEL
ncbi:hypothetical protein R1sor_027583 [Riccia sorocarpa]|uniref:BHLH domain-containing protein n=1 Tax=Riccia sorocarpa TaxID=122646 RepID=A0ABD3GHX8_9MARC